ncbi:MAG: hypothetical protein KBS83_04920 [Lachnospiraceae bacterium]|nr:hypothetical protein [Candidatus Equihabitans merdae]
MFRLWGKIWQDNHLLRDIVIEDDTDDTRTHKVFHAITDICREFDLAEPIWLTANINEFKRLSKTRFSRDSFVESIEFDYLEIQVIEE